MLNERELSVLPRATVSTSEFCLRTLTVIVFRLKLLTPDCEAMADSVKTNFHGLLNDKTDFSVAIDVRVSGENQ